MFTSSQDQPPIPSRQRIYSVAIAAGLLYGLALRLLFHLPPFANKSHPLWIDRFYPNDLWVMTAGFLLVAPFTIGYLTASAAQTDRTAHWGRWVTLPWMPMLLADLCLALAGVEGLICIVLAIPITLIFASLGGIAGGLVAQRQFRNGRAATFCFAVLPLLMAAVEVQGNGPLELRTVQTSIVIHAPAQTIWRNIERVPAIRPSELQPTWAHRIGFPLPVEATLDREGVGGVRHASFEHGLLFLETIDVWQPLQRIGFTIAADTAHIPPTTLDEHVTIGGRYFDVLNGEYRLEPLPDGSILLHLSSRERLSTDFNRYAALWSDAVMRDLQNSILEVVKHRCERGAADAGPRAPLRSER